MCNTIYVTPASSLDNSDINCVQQIKHLNPKLVIDVLTFLQYMNIFFACDSISLSVLHKF